MFFAIVTLDQGCGGQHDGVNRDQRCGELQRCEGAERKVEGGRRRGEGGRWGFGGGNICQRTIVSSSFILNPSSTDRLKKKKKIEYYTARTRRFNDSGIVPLRGDENQALLGNPPYRRKMAVSSVFRGTSVRKLPNIGKTRLFWSFAKRRQQIPHKGHRLRNFSGHRALRQLCQMIDHGEEIIKLGRSRLYIVVVRR